MEKKDDDKLWNDYFYPGTDVLINKFDERDYQKLKEIDATYSFERLLELREKPIDLGFGKDHLNAVHKYIFDDVYPFAGEYRKVNMRKVRGTFFFMHKSDDIDRELDFLFSEVNEKLLHCSKKIEFCEILAKLYTSLIYLHPYREGNGRAIREFLREFSIKKSYELGFGRLELDWSLISFKKLNQYIEVSHLFPSATAILFMNALEEVDDSKKNNI